MSARIKESFVCWSYSLKSIQQGVYILNIVWTSWQQWIVCDHAKP